MNKIHILPPSLVAKIAAGEVIERPAFAVKELVENAIDAGANQIAIDITKGGLESIVVSDTGEGMSQADLFLCWQRHTTSKTALDSDLTNIDTLGFRGEALSSVAAVSNLTIQSRQAQDPGGNTVEIRNGTFLQSMVVGMAPGTIVRVEQVFSALPARQKFLASAQTEWQHIVHSIEAYAVAYPGIRFILRHNGRRILDVPRQTKEERLALMLGAEVVEQMFPFRFDDPHVSISGFLGKPQVSFHSNFPSYLIVNNRVIKNKAIAQAIKSAYRSLLKVDASPFFLLFLRVPYEMVDVNIHPRKEEIKFLNEQELCKKIAEEITAVASRQNFSFQWSTPKGDTHSFAAKTIQADMVSSLKQIRSTTGIFQVHNLYLISPTERGLLLIDQHAAHERILYERFCQRYTDVQQKQKTFVFSKPQTLSLPLSQSTLVEDNLPMLKTMGFRLEKSTQQSYFIQAVPDLFRDRNILQLFQEIFGDLEQAQETPSIDKHTNRMLSFLACRSAIKSGEPLTQAEIKKLVKELSETKTSYTCPHGRPTHIEISLYDLEKAFGRRGG